MRDSERPTLIIFVSALLFSCGVASLVSFVIRLYLTGIEIYALQDLFFGIFFVIVGYLLFSIRYITMGVLISLVLGASAILFYVNQKIIEIAILWECIVLVVAGILGFIARRRINWLVEREEPLFRELKFILRMIRKSKITLVAIGVIIIFYLMAIFAPYIAPYDPNAIDSSNILAPPSRDHLLGTDMIGRDILCRIIYGSEISMFIGIVAVFITVSIGLPIGLIAGYFGGKIDEVLMRVTDTFLAFPELMLALLISYILGRGHISALIGLSLVGWTVPTRLIRGVVLSEKEKEYVIAARAQGMSDVRILFNEILPNSIHPIITQAMLSIGATIISMAGLSFLGVGTQPPTPDWGVMISDGRRYLTTQPWFSITPGILIIIVVLCFNMVGDTLRDALDPILRRQR
jgi:peptide/nickel transport system permease protein